MPALTSSSGRCEPHAQTLRALLSTEVEIRAPEPAAVCTVRNFEASHIGVLKSSGDAMRIVNGTSDSASVYLCRLERGRSTLHHELGTSVIQAGEFVAFHGSRALDVRHDLPFEMLGVRLPERVLRRWLPDWDSAEFLPVPRDDAEGRILFEMADDLLQTGPRLKANSTEALGEAMSRLLAQSLMTISDGGSELGVCQGEAHRRRVKQFCRRHIGCADLNVGFISKGVGLSASHLHRLFEGEPLTLMAWIQVERLEQSRRTIAHDPQGSNLLQVALAYGFKDAAHYSHAFRRRFGICPRDYRRSLAYTTKLAA